MDREEETDMRKIDLAETSQKTRETILSARHDQSLEQALYCAYGYVDALTGNRCQDCNLTNYGRDCNNNPVASR